MRAALFTATVLLAAAAALAQDPEPVWVEQARTSAAELGGRLQQELQAAMREGGPVSGIEVCKTRAPEIAATVSGPKLDVGRTALRIRNPDNTPDPWEVSVLEDFERRAAAGETPGQFESFVIRNDGQRRFGHWMKAIPTQGLCATCHGVDIAPEVVEAIDAAYPQDRARGFSAGDLRGAFSVEVDLD